MCGQYLNINGDYPVNEDQDRAVSPMFHTLSDEIKRCSDGRWVTKYACGRGAKFLMEDALRAPNNANCYIMIGLYTQVKDNTLNGQVSQMQQGHA